MRARDGSSFLVEKRSEQVLVNDMPAQIHALKGGEEVELVTEVKRVKISGAEYWDLFFADITPTKMEAGLGFHVGMNSSACCNV